MLWDRTKRWSSRRRPVMERFWEKVRTAGHDECWEWLGGTGTHGYGVFVDDDGRRVLAHRFAYEKLVGPIREGRCVCHTCDNRLCVSPYHLWSGTREDNLADMTQKNRCARGEKQGGAKLTETDVRKIRWLCEQGATQAEVAGQFGVAQVTVCKVVNRKTWKHVE